MAGVNKEVRWYWVLYILHSFVMPVTGLNRPNTGKEDDDDDILH
jgi:hypothetical protein